MFSAWFLSFLYFLFTFCVFCWIFVFFCFFVCLFIFFYCFFVTFFLFTWFTYVSSSCFTPIFFHFCLTFNGAVSSSFIIQFSSFFLIFTKRNNKEDYSSGFFLLSHARNTSLYSSRFLSFYVTCIIKHHTFFNACVRACCVCAYVRMYHSLTHSLYT